jgi:hypothetical protein
VLTNDDREDFQRAITLIRDVVSRHSAAVTGPVIVALQLAVNDIAVVEKYLASTDAQEC